MKSIVLILSFSFTMIAVAFAQTNAEETIKQLSKDKWQWMANKESDKLAVLFDEKCDFVHMGGTWGKVREVEVIKSGFKWYKYAEVYSTQVKFHGNTAIFDLVAQVGGNEVTNPFMVTEVYVFENNAWQMTQLTFSHLARSVKFKQ